MEVKASGGGVVPMPPGLSTLPRVTWTLVGKERCADVHRVADAEALNVAAGSGA